MKILYNIPFSRDKNLGKAYNDFMKLLQPEDYAVFLDRDAMFTDTFYANQIEDIIKGSRQALYTCLTNRVNCRQQIAEKVDWWNDDLKYHMRIGKELAEQKRNVVIDVTGIYPEISGVMMAVSKKWWDKVGGFNEGGMLGVDNNYHQRIRNAGGCVYLMKGVYVYHWYRGGDCKQVSHLK